MRHRFSGRGLLLTGAAALLGATLQAGPVFATQPVSGLIEADTAGAGAPESSHIDQWAAAEGIRDLSAQSGYHSAAPNFPFAESHVVINSHWDSANAGKVFFTNDGITMAQGNLVDDDLLALYGAAWEYRFIADTDGVLNFDLAAALIGDGEDIGAWRVGAADLSTRAPPVIRATDGYPFGHQTLALSGSLNLIAGHLYELVVSDDGDSRNFESPGLLLGNESGIMTWSITTSDAPPSTAIPEPDAWALLILGFAGVGLGLRHRVATA